MSERILEIVIFLMDYMRSRRDQIPDTDDFSTILRNMGYTDSEISSAYFWLLNRFDHAPEELWADFPQVSQSTRVLTESERLQLTTGAYGLLLKLLNLGLIDDEDLETVLERIVLFGTEPATKDQIKLVVSSLVFDDIDTFVELDVVSEESGQSLMVN